MPGPNSEGSRELLGQLFLAAVAAAHPDRCLPQHLPAFPPRGRLIVAGAGKAAAAMASATARFYSDAADRARLSGFVATRHGWGMAMPALEVVEAGHPVPDAQSVAAAERALALARSAGSDDLVLCLLSGGASALWTAPVEGLGLDAKQQLTKALLRAGARISEINCVRKHLSRIKGGRLAAAAYPARLLTLAISDVPGDDPATIGSGPTVGDPTTLAEARAVLHRYAIAPAPEIAAALARPENETLKPGVRELASASYRLVATPAKALEAAAGLARGAGYQPRVLGDALEGEARVIAAAHARLALDAKQRGERVAILSGGELTVTVRGSGAGGPNQEYALALAVALGEAPGIAAVAADTDGTDGGGGNVADPAGAIVTSNSLARARDRDLNAATFLENNDSTAFFRALGDLVETGPTHTNVNDFRAILVDPDAPA
jgi:hydroxypyruvate reductase